MTRNGSPQVLDGRTRQQKPLFVLKETRREPTFGSTRRRLHTEKTSLRGIRFRPRLSSIWQKLGKVPTSGGPNGPDNGRRALYPAGSGVKSRRQRSSTRTYLHRSRETR